MQKKVLEYFFILAQVPSKEKNHLNNDQEFSIKTLNFRIINSMFCNFGLLINGYYNDSFAISRNIHESLYLSKYLMTYPDEVDKWISGEQISHSLVIEKLKISEPNTTIYGLLCDFTHSNFRGTTDHIILNFDKVDRNRGIAYINIRMTPFFNKDIARQLFLVQFIQSMESIENFYSFFKNCDWCNFDDKLKNELIDLKKESIKILKKNFPLS